VKGRSETETTWEETSLDQDSCAGLAAGDDTKPARTGSENTQAFGAFDPGMARALLRDGAGARQGRATTEALSSRSGLLGGHKIGRRLGTVKY
jgi:hypothetical protein